MPKKILLKESSKSRDSTGALLAGIADESGPLLRQVLARLDRVDNALAGIADGSGPLQERYGKDTTTYLDLLHLVAANKIQVNNHGSHKDVLVKSVQELLYNSVTRHALETGDDSEKEEDFAFPARLLDTALETINRDAVEANTDVLLMKPPIRLPKKTLIRGGEAAESNEQHREEGQDVISESKLGNEEDSEDSDEQTIIVAQQQEPSPLQAGPSQLKTPSLANIADNSEFLSDSLMLSPISDKVSATNGSRRQRQVLKPKELEMLTLDARRSSAVPSLPSPTHMTRGDQIVERILAQRKSRRLSLQQQFSSPLRAASSQSHAAPRKLYDHNGNIGLSPVSSARSTASAEDSTAQPDQPLPASTPRPSSALNESKFPADQSSIMNASTTRRTLRPRRNVSYRDVHNSTVTSTPKSSTRPKRNKK